MVRIGGLLTFFGLGSVLLYSFDMQFRILEWAEPMQPWLGVVLGLAGVAVLGVKLLGSASSDQPVTEPAPGGQPFAPPPGGYAPPPNVQRGQGFPPGQGIPPGGGFAGPGQQQQPHGQPFPWQPGQPGMAPGHGQPFPPPAGSEP